MHVLPTHGYPVPGYNCSRHLCNPRPCRPNAIGLSIVRLVAVNGCEIIIKDVDALDRTPLLDIKPYVPAFDCYPDEKAGWLTGGKDMVISKKSDGRFGEKGD
jgi:Uncharacterized conserved protein